MARPLPIQPVVCLLIAFATSALGDGIVLPEVFRPKVEIPNQQALIHHSRGTETLVIETSFIGEGTNFAWVVPLPAPPEVRPVSENFFRHLEGAFRPHLVHKVTPYYAAILFVLGLAFLGSRALKDEVSWLNDLPLCILMAAGAWWFGGHAIFAILAMGCTLAIRLSAKSPAIYAWLLLIGTSFAAILITVPNYKSSGLIVTMGGEHSEEVRAAGVSVLSVQHAGVFDAATIRGHTPDAVLTWLTSNGFSISKQAEPVIQKYIDQGWVFVASKIRRGLPSLGLAALHPLAFTFASEDRIYPTMLTGVGSSECAIDLYVFGDRRASARHFKAVRSDHCIKGPMGRKASISGLQISDPEVLACIGDSATGTKLSGTLSPGQMASDVRIKTSLGGTTGRFVYSFSGAATIALNVLLPLAAVSWLLVGACRGGWSVTERWVMRWRLACLAAAVVIGLAVFLILPKVEVEMVPQSFGLSTPPQLCSSQPAHFESHSYINSAVAVTSLSTVRRTQ